MKIVYICHGWQLGAEGQPLINEVVQAWKYGPVIPTLYQEIRKFGSEPVTQLDAPDEEFSAEEEDLIALLASFYGKYSGIRLSKMTHEQDTPWGITWQQNGQNAVISNDLIQDYYARHIEQANDEQTA